MGENLKMNELIENINKTADTQNQMVKKVVAIIDKFDVQIEYERKNIVEINQAKLSKITSEVERLEKVKAAALKVSPESSDLVKLNI